MRVLILRPEEVLSNTVEKFRKEGIEAHGCPFVKIRYKDFKIPEHEFAIVMSQNSAKAIVEKGIRLKNVIAVGKKTAEVLEKAGYKVLVPRRFESSAIVEEFSELLRGKRVVAIRSNSGSEVLRKLQEIADYREVHAYEIEKLHGEEQREEIRKVIAGYYDAIVFSSRMIAESFLEICELESLRKLKGIKFIAIGEPTADFLREKGFDVLVPEEFTFDGVIKLIKSLKGADFQC